MTTPVLPQLPRQLPKTPADWQLFLNTMQAWASILAPSGFTGTVTTAKVTAGGTTGSMTFVNGVLTGQVAAT
jgi:hypothetical protein